MYERGDRLRRFARGQGIAGKPRPLADSLHPGAPRGMAGRVRIAVPRLAVAHRAASGRPVAAGDAAADRRAAAPDRRRTDDSSWPAGGLLFRRAADRVRLAANLSIAPGALGCGTLRDRDLPHRRQTPRRPPGDLHRPGDRPGDRRAEPLATSAPRYDLRLVARAGMATPGRPRSASLGQRPGDCLRRPSPRVVSLRRRSLAGCRARFTPPNGLGSRVPPVVGTRRMTSLRRTPASRFRFPATVPTVPSPICPLASPSCLTRKTVPISSPILCLAPIGVPRPDCLHVVLPGRLKRGERRSKPAL